jgi:hypothetical protein
VVWLTQADASRVSKTAVSMVAHELKRDVQCLTWQKWHADKPLALVMSHLLGDIRMSHFSSKKPAVAYMLSHV